jgi:hypothetical protein
MRVLKKHLSYIKKIKIDGYMDVQGGEIGLVPVKLLEYFFKTMNTKMFISTNGEFIKRGLHRNKNIKPYIKLIQWHIHPKPNGNILIEDINDSNFYISKGIVHDNKQEMIDFINTNKHIQFDYLDFEYKDDLYLEHDRSKYLDLYKSIEKLENVTKDAKKRILSRISESISLRDICRSRNDSIIINLVNETICLCQRNLHINIPLSKENILDFIEKKYPYKIFNYDNNNCSSCGRLYEGKTRRLFGI